MTIAEAVKEWKISEKKMCRYLANGIITDIQVVDDTIIIPNIPEPLVPADNAKITHDSVSRYILQALSSFKYIDYKILFIEAEQFAAIMKQLEEKRYVKKEKADADYFSTNGFSCTDAGAAKQKARKFRLKGLNFELGFLFKLFYIKVGAEIVTNKTV